MKLGGERFPADQEGVTWLQVDDVESGDREAYPSSSRGGGNEEAKKKSFIGSINLPNLSQVRESFSFRDKGELRRETVISSFISDPQSIYIWYYPRCSAAWIVPVLYFVVCLISVVVADIILDDYYADMIVALVASAIYFCVVAFYFIGRYLDMRYSAHYQSCNVLWRYIFFPIGCMRVNANNIVNAASIEADLDAERRKRKNTKE